MQPDEGPLELQLARLLKEEAYLKSRLAYVQQVPPTRTSPLTPCARIVALPISSTCRGLAT